MVVSAHVTSVALAGAGGQQILATPTAAALPVEGAVRWVSCSEPWWWRHRVACCAQGVCLAVALSPPRAAKYMYCSGDQDSEGDHAAPRVARSTPCNRIPNEKRPHTVTPPRGHTQVHVYTRECSKVSRALRSSATTRAHTRARAGAARELQAPGPPSEPICI